jgi:hypothetical protein
MRYMRFWILQQGAKALKPVKKRGASEKEKNIIKKAKEEERASQIAPQKLRIR